MTAAYSRFAKVGRRVDPEPIPDPTIPRGVLRLALAVVLVLVALPLAGSARDWRADRRLAQLDDPTTSAGDYGRAITED